jgi:hypothetical protein
MEQRRNSKLALTAQFFAEQKDAWQEFEMDNNLISKYLLQ